MEGAKKIAIAATLGNLLQGWDNGAIAGALLYLKPEFGLDNNPGLEGMVVASTLVGAWMSTLCSGPAADFLGRRLVLCISAVLYSTSAAAMLCSPNVYVLIASRMLVGTGIGLCVTIIPIYISESAPAEIRGQLSTLPQLMGSGGLFGVYVMVFILSLTENPNWRYMLGALILPSVIFMGLTAFYLPESPRWLVSKGRMREAKLVLQNLRNQTDVTAELALLVEGLGVGGETTLEEWLLEPGNAVSEDNDKMADGDLTLKKHERRISWIGTPESGHHGLLSRRASLEPGSLSLMDPMVSIMGSLRQSVLGVFEDKDEQSEEESNHKAALSDHSYQSDEEPSLDSGDKYTTPLLSKALVNKADPPSSFKVNSKDTLTAQIRSRPNHLQSPVASYQDHPSIASWKYSQGNYDKSPLLRANSRRGISQDNQLVGSAHYSSLPRSTMPIGSIPSSMGSVGIGGGWQLAWITTEGDSDGLNKENAAFKRVFLRQEGAASPHAASAYSLLSGVEAEAQISAAALVARPAQSSKDIFKVDPLGPAMVHPAQTAVKGPAWRDLMEVGVRRALIVGVGLQILQQFSGINAVLYFVPQILQQSGAEMLLADMGVGANSASILGSGVTCLLMLPCIVLAMRLMDHAGRRQMLLGTLPILFCSLIGMVIAFLLLPPGLLQALASFIGVTVYICTFVMGFGPIPNILGAEIFPTRVRGVCIGICQATMWTCNIIMTNLFPILLVELGIGGVFGIFAVVSLFSWLFVFMRVPETKGMPLELISEFFAMSVTATSKSATS